MKLAVCGDSFCTPDPEYGKCWVDILSEQFQIINYSQPSSSNLLISKQIDKVLLSNPDFIIVSFTSCTRGEKKHNGVYEPFSYHTASETTTPFKKNDIELLKQYFIKFFDLELSIYQNQIIIEHALSKLEKSKIPFIFSSGGFEHQQQKKYFEDYNECKSDINLWDYSDTKDYRPYYHIIDVDVHNTIAQYFLKKLKSYEKFIKR